LPAGQNALLRVGCVAAFIGLWTVRRNDLRRFCESKDAIRTAEEDVHVGDSHCLYETRCEVPLLQLNMSAALDSAF
jgi:hypothetical protein